MKTNRLVLKGICLYSENKDRIKVTDGYAVAEDGICRGVFEELPEAYQKSEIEDYSGKLIIPGFTDLHLHAPQYGMRATGMDMELLEWLNTYTFPEEAKYRDLSYAEPAYEIFVKELLKSPTTRACIFGTIFNESNLELMRLLEKSGMVTMVGKVNMDRNSPEYLIEESAERSAKDTIDFIEEALTTFKHTVPILTPRFIPTCSDELMEKLSSLKKTYKIPLQSHLSENQSEIAWVRELCPDCKTYTQAYDNLGALDECAPTVMAHCIYLSEEEEKLLKKKNVYIAHCPESNMNLASGIAPIRKYLEHDLSVGLGSDIGAGAHVNLFYAMQSAIHVSKLYHTLVDRESKPLTLQEAFYMATKGGGSFFGKVGSLEDGYAMDAVVLETGSILYPKKLSALEMLESMIYLGDNTNVYAKYVNGNLIYHSKDKQVTL